MACRFRVLVKSAVAALAVLAALLGAVAAAKASRGLLVGPAEDAGKTATVADAKTKMDLARTAGLEAIRLTAQWRTGRRAPLPGDLEGLKNAVAAADEDGVVVFLSVYPSGSSVTPLTAPARSDFAAFATSLAMAYRRSGRKRPKTRASRRRSCIPGRRRSPSPTTGSSRGCSGRRSTGRSRPGRACRSSTTSSASSR